MDSNGSRNRGSLVDEEESKVLDPVGFGASRPFLPRPPSRELKGESANARRLRI